MRKKKKIKAIYIIAAIWLLSMIGFPLWNIIRVLIIGAISLGILGFVVSELSKNDQPTIKSRQAGQNAGTNQTSNGQNYRTNQTAQSSGATGTANPYSSNYRYSANRQTSQQTQPKDETVEVKLSRREKKKLAKQAAMEAELAKAREAEAAKLAEEKKKEEEKKRAEEAKKVQSQTIFEKYNVPKRKRTGDAAIDKMLEDEENAIAEMRRLDDEIEDAKISAQIVHLEDVTAKIVDYVISHPDKKNQVRRFFNYYLPTSIKLLNSYNLMDDAGISGMNIDGTKGQVEVMMDKALEAFDNQLDALYGDEAMDVAAEIKVMEGLLAQEGITDEIMASQKK